MKIDTSNIVKKQIASDYERKYGKGKGGKNNMAFAALRYILFGAFIVIGAVAVIHFIMVLTSHGGFLNEFWAIKPIETFFGMLGSAVTFLIGYLFRGASE